MGTDAEPETKCGEGAGEDPPVEFGSNCGADRHIGQVPECVGDVEQRDEIAPARPGGRVERRAFTHAFRAHMTSPPPSDIGSTSTSVNPAVSHALVKRSGG